MFILKDNGVSAKIKILQKSSPSPHLWNHQYHMQDSNVLPTWLELSSGIKLVRLHCEYFGDSWYYQSKLNRFLRLFWIAYSCMMLICLQPVISVTLIKIVLLLKTWPLYILNSFRISSKKDSNTWGSSDRHWLISHEIISMCAATPSKHGSEQSMSVCMPSFAW